MAKQSSYAGAGLCVGGRSLYWGGWAPRLTAADQALWPVGVANYLSIGPNCAVVLAMGAIESTRLALLSFPTPLMGRNLMVHLRTNLTVRIRKSAFAAALPAQLETAAVLVRGSTAHARFHLQFTASASPNGFSEEVMFRMIPDLDLMDSILASQNADWISITIRGLAEMKGGQVSIVPNNTGSWIDLSPFESDEFGVARAWVQLVATGADNAVWDTMDQAALALVQQVAGSAANIEYFYNHGWQSTPPTLATIRSQMRDGLRTTHHESGTLWMGAPGSSVTDENGRFHHVSNAYVADFALFPTLGSANSALTGLTLARKVAEAIA